MARFYAEQPDYIAQLNQLADGSFFYAPEQSANFTADRGWLYPIVANNLQITLPAAPLAGWRLRLLATTAAVTTTTVLRNGSNIDSVGADRVFSSVDRMLNVEFVYVNATVGWRVTYLGYDSTTSKAVRRNAIRGGDASTNPWQRGTSFTGLGAVTQYTADGWIFSNSTTGVVNFAKAANAPTVAQAGRLLTDCFDFTVTTAAASISPFQFATFEQKIEGYVWKRYAQRPTAIRFQHAHTKTGTHCVAIRNSGADRALVMEYTQQVSGAWEEAVLDLPASPSAGTWNYTTGVGLTLDFVIAAGSSVQGTAGSWQSSNIIATANQVNNLDAVSNHFRIADVRLVLGSAVNGGEIEVRDAAEELLIAQRFLPMFVTAGNTGERAQGAGIVGNQMGIPIIFKVPTRIPPTGVTVSAAGDFSIYRYAGNNSLAVTAISLQVAGVNTAMVLATVAAGITAGDMLLLSPANANAFMYFTGAEL